MTEFQCAICYEDCTTEAIMPCCHNPNSSLKYCTDCISIICETPPGRCPTATCRELIEDYQDQTETIFDMGRNSEAAATNQADTENGDVIEDSQSTVNNIIIGESKGIKISEYR